MGSVFGGSKSSSTSSNKAYDYIKDTFSPVASYAGTGADAISKLLSGDASGFEGFKNATGFNNTLSRGLSSITGTGAARGMLRSGMTDKALGNYISGTQNQYYNDYLSQLGNLSQLGLGAGGLIGQTGQVTKSKSKSKPGMGGLIGGVLTGGATGGF